MGAATPRYALRGLFLLGACLWISPSFAQDGELPNDRRALERPEEKSTESAGFELPPAPGDATSSADPAVDPMKGWSSDDPRIARRESRLMIAGSAYGFAGAFAGLSVWTLVTSTTFDGEKPRRDWRKAALLLAGLSAVGLTIGTIAWVSAPSLPKQGDAFGAGGGLALRVSFTPSGVSAGLQLKFF